LLAPMIITGAEVGTVSPGGRLEINVTVHSFNEQRHSMTTTRYSKYVQVGQQVCSNCNSILSVFTRYTDGTWHKTQQEQQILFCWWYIILSTESQCDINCMLCTPCCFHPTTSLKCPPSSIPIVTHRHTSVSIPKSVSSCVYLGYFV
jgi:hypothetical protein